MHHPIRVLFLCEGNADRSQMAEGLLRKLGGADFDVHSAGLEPREIDPLAIQVMNEIGIDISSHGITHLDDYLDTQFDYVISLCDQAKNSCIAFPRDGHNLHWACMDPSAAGGSDAVRLDAYRQVRDAITTLLRPWIEDTRRNAV